MKRRLAAALLAAMLPAILGACRNEAAPAEAAKPTVHVLTSLPLLFDEGFGLQPAKGEAATFLRKRYRLKPIDLPSQLPAGGVLLAAQPRALPAEELVALDAWVRGGGKLLLLADPMLEWPSKRPLGDRLRPPVSFADTGLLMHWGLRLDAPDKRESITIRRMALSHSFRPACWSSWAVIAHLRKAAGRRCVDWAREPPPSSPTLTS